MNLKVKMILEYFNAWITKDCSGFESFFSHDVIYSECYGPEYHGISQITKWFLDWNKRGNIVEWRIKQFIHSNQITVVEWYFRCEYDGVISDFDGVSLIEFNDNKMVSVKEFQSKAEHNYPYL